MNLAEKLVQRRWWRADDREPHLAIMEIAKKAMDDGRRKRYRALEQLYAETVVTDEVATMLGITERTWNRIPVARSAVDTLHNRIGKARPRPWFVTTDGDWEASQKAELLTSWCDGQFEQREIYALGRSVLKDAAIFGTGALKTSAANGEPCSELVWAGDLHVDPREAKHNCVRTLYQTTPMDRGVLADLFPEHESAISDLLPWRDESEPDDPEKQLADDLVLVVEAWRLPTGRGADGSRTGGRHVIAIDGLSLVDEPYERRTFPFDFLHYRSVPRRFWGLGLVESVACMHADLQELSESIGEAYDLMTPGVVAEENSVPKKCWNNEVGRLITHAPGTNPPQPWVPPAVSPDFLAREQTLMQRCYELEGISQLSAQSVKPAGLNSGKALMVHQDVETERFTLLSQDYESFFVGVAKHLVEVAEEIADSEDYDEDAKLDVLGGRRTVEAIRYEEVRLDASEYVLRVWPVSALATSPQGRLEQVDMLRQVGVITDPNEIRSLLDFPDLDRANSLALAGRDLVDKMISNALRGKKAYAHQYMPLDYALTRATQQRALAEIRGAPSSALARLDDLIGAIESIRRRQTPPAPPAGAGAPQGPMGPSPMPPALPAPGMAA